jgi:hypothetical protein
MRRPAAARVATYSVLGLIALAGLALRLWNNDHGLPFVYNFDERAHFAGRAVAMIAGGDLDPGYYQNPSGFTYLVYAVLRLAFEDDALARIFSADPTAVIDLSRDLTAILATVGVIAVFALGRTLAGPRVGLVAAAIVAFAFLPVALSRLALTDVGTLAPVALTVLGSALALERGRARDFLLAGVGVGLATGFKYTAGLVVVSLLTAGGVRLVRDRDRRALAGLALGLGAALLAFFVTTPFVFLEPAKALAQLAAQADAAGSPKLGQGGDSPVGYYLESLTWGLGWVLAAATLGGAALVLRQTPARAAVLLAPALALFLYLSVQERFFGRWLLPVYPVLAVLAAVALCELAHRATDRFGPRRRGLVEAALVVALCAVALAQPLAADWRSARLHGRADTRSLARAWLEPRARPELRIVIEPEVPPSYHRPDRGGPALFMRHFEREAKRRGLDYSETLSPATLDRYRASGYCTVMTLGYVRGRVERDSDPGAIDYYRRLEDESRLLHRESPRRAGAAPLGFHFDLSYNGYPAAVVRPGPEVRILRLDRCRQGYGPLSRAERRAISLGPL